MRIIGYIEHPSLKITVFQMNNKLSVQFESGLYAQIYKVRENDQVRAMGDVQKLVDGEFIANVLSNFQQMHQQQMQAMQRQFPLEETEEFEEII